MNYKEYIKYLLESFTPKQIKQLTDKFKLENPLLTDTQIKHYVEEFDKNRNNPKIQNKDIFSYTFKELEKLIDSMVIQSHTEDRDINGTPIYQEGSISVYEGTNKRTCIDIGKKESWCISRQDASNMYNTYRYLPIEPNFYFIRNTDLPDTDKWSFFVLMSFNSGKYGLASRENSGNFTGSQQYSWDQVISYVPFIADLKSLFIYKPLTDEEKRVYEIVSHGIYQDDLLRVLGSLYLVEAYISYGHTLTDQQFINLNNPELRMKYINLGQNLPTDAFKSLTEPEMKRYFTIIETREGFLNLNYITSLPENIKFPDIVNALSLKHITHLPNNIKFPNIIDGTLDLYNLKSIPDNIKFPDSVGFLNVYNLKSIGDNVTFPRKIMDDYLMEELLSIGKNFKFPEIMSKFGLNLYRLTSLPEDTKFPNDIQFLNLYRIESLPNNIKFPNGLRNLCLRSLTLLPDNIEFPDSIRFLDLGGLNFLPDNFKFPTNLTGLILDMVEELQPNIMFPTNLEYLRLRSLKYINNLEFPKYINGDLNLNSLREIGDNVKFPDKITGNLNLHSVESIGDNVKFPSTITGYINFKMLNELPKYIKDNLKPSIKIYFKKDQGEY